MIVWAAVCRPAKLSPEAGAAPPIPSSVLVCSQTRRCPLLRFPPGCEVASCGLDLHALATNGIEPLLLCLLFALFGEIFIQRL